MVQLSSILILFGGIGAMAGVVWMLIEAFRAHWLWGVCCCLIPGAIFFWLYRHRREGWKPFCLAVGGFALALGSYRLLG